MPGIITRSIFYKYVLFTITYNGGWLLKRSVGWIWRWWNFGRV